MANEIPIRYFVDFGGEVIPVRTITGNERLSAPFSFTARFTTEALGEEPEALLKMPAGVRMDRDGEIVRAVAGIITEASIGASIRGAPEVKIVIEPRLALLRHRSDYRVFRDKTAPQIVSEVLSHLGVAHEQRLSSSYETRAYTVQCRETDLDFVHRMLEDEGIFYYFLPSGVMVLGDSPGAYDAIPGDPKIPFRAGHGLDRGGDAVSSVGRRSKVAIGKVSLRDFDLDRPRLDLDARADGPMKGGPEYYDYPGEYSDPGAGARKAKLHAEAHACDKQRIFGESLTPRIVPGHTFTLEGSPRGVADGALVVVAVTHDFARDRDGFTCSFEALGASTTFRPMRVTNVPTNTNPMTGFVTGPSGEDIHTDPRGRVKVRFPWDRVQPADDTVSDWVPVLQDNTGHSVGIPRVGWEVLVHFQEGDPDRPVVLGRVYNAEDKFPVDLPAGKTKTALKSLSSPSRAGTNQIEVDDLAGSEKVTIIAERDHDVNVANDQEVRTLRDKVRRVGGDEQVSIGRDTSLWVGADRSLEVTGDQTHTVMGSRDLDVAGSQGVTVSGDRSLTIAHKHTRRIGTDDTVTAKDITERIGALDLEVSVKPNTTTADKLLAVTVGGAHIEAVKKGKSESTKYARAETVGGVAYTKAGESITSSAGKKHITTVGGVMSVTSAERLSMVAGKKLSYTAATGTFESDGEVSLKVGDSSIIVKDGKVAITAKKITFTMDGAGTYKSGDYTIVPVAATSTSADAGGQDTKGADAKVAANKAALQKALAAGVSKTKGPRDVTAPLDACNVSVRNVLETYNAETGAGLWTPSVNDLSTDIINNLNGGKVPGATAVDAATAQALANQGEVVIAAGVGHVATVAGGQGSTVAGTLYPMLQGGSTNTAIRSTNPMSANYVFPRSAFNNGQVTYYHISPPPPPPPPPPDGPKI